MSISFRFFICVVLTLISAAVFLFAPEFNFGGVEHQSIYHQYVMQGQLWEAIKRVGGLTVIVFVSLVILFGFKGSNKNKT
jgi:hypothetical protein